MQPINVHTSPHGCYRPIARLHP